MVLYYQMIENLWHEARSFHKASIKLYLVELGSVIIFQRQWSRSTDLLI